MKQVIDFETQLQTVPLRNERVTLEPSAGDPDVVIATIQLRYNGIMAVAKKLFKPRSYRRYELAGLTRELYEKIDGKVTVDELILSLQAGERLTFFEARAFVVQYLKDMMQRGLIVVVAPDADVDEG